LCFDFINGIAMINAITTDDRHCMVPGGGGKLGARRGPFIHYIAINVLLCGRSGYKCLFEVTANILHQQRPFDGTNLGGNSIESFLV
jgi:hypothetical protein